MVIFHSYVSHYQRVTSCDALVTTGGAVAHGLCGDHFDHGTAQTPDILGMAFRPGQGLMFKQKNQDVNLINIDYMWQHNDIMQYTVYLFRTKNKCE